MKCKDTYTLTLKEPLVLFERAKTEANLNMLTYIPGSVFRGIAAGQLFGEKKSDTIIDSLIFKGDVQFGDAHLTIDGTRGLATPASLYTSKAGGATATYQLHHQNSSEEIPKQVKSGYFNAETNEHIIFEVEFEDSLKAARDRKTGSPKKGQMYLYRSMNKGQTFSFDVRANTSEELEQIKTILHSKTFFIGKSKSSEFGGKAVVQWESRSDQNATYAAHASNAYGTVVYAESNLCFLNAFGAYSWQPTGKQLTGTNAAIDWEKSKVWFHQYAPFNGKRKTFDAERLIIKKGSVFVFKTQVEVGHEQLQQGVGVHRTEGLGRILVNPSFLVKPAVFIVPASKNELAKETRELESSTIPLVQCLIEKRSTRLMQNGIETLIDKSINTNRKALKGRTTKTQWSNVAAAAVTAATADELHTKLFDKDEGLLYKGASNFWSTEQRKTMMNIFKALKEDSKNTNNRMPLVGIAVLAKKMNKTL